MKPMTNLTVVTSEELPSEMETSVSSYKLVMLFDSLKYGDVLL